MINRSGPAVPDSLLMPQNASQASQGRYNGLAASLGAGNAASPLNWFTPQQISSSPYQPFSIPGQYQGGYVPNPVPYAPPPSPTPAPAPQTSGGYTLPNGFDISSILQNLGWLTGGIF